MDPELRTLERRFRRTIVVAWWLPVGISVVLQSFLGFWTLGEAFLVLGTYTGLYCVLFTVLAVVVLGRQLRAALIIVQDDRGTDRLAQPIGLRRIPLTFVALYVIYIGFGPIMAYLNLTWLTDNTYTLGQYLYASFGAVPSVLIAAFPIFFYASDLVGRYLAPRGVQERVAPLWLRLVVLGLVSPVVVDVVLLIYYENRTGFFAPETLVLWTSLLIISALGTWLAHRSLRSSLEPLRQRAGTFAQPPDHAPHFLAPRSLDEIGELTRACNEQAAAQYDAEVRYRQAQKMEAVGQITGGVAHDFNNLLTVIMGNLELLRDDLVDGRDAGAFVDEATAAVERGATLTNRLLAFARRQPLRPEPLDVRDVIDDLWAILTATVGERIALTRAIQPSLWTCEADPGQLQSALLNLVINARDAIQGGGTITIEGYNVTLDGDYVASHGMAEVRPGDYAVVSVTDTGTGIPPDVIERVFDPFFTTKGVGKGSGLGLNMVFGFARQSGGNATIYSEVDRGTVVKLYLPRSGDPAPRAERDRVAEGWPQGRGEVVLVVEDEPAVRSVVVELLCGAGYEAHAAGSGAEALSLLPRIAPPDLLVTDVVLPGDMNGTQVAEALCTRVPHLAVLYMSGYTQNVVWHDGRLDPDVALIEKPFRKSDLLRQVRRVLDRPPEPP